MNFLFYHGLLAEKLYTPTDKIVYSFLIYKSIPLIDCVFTSDGEDLDPEAIKEALEFDEHILLYSISQRKLAKELNISAKAVYNSLDALCEHGDIDKINQAIRADPELVFGKRYPILLNSGLVGELLIFYSYLKNKCEYFGGSIDTFKYKLADDFCTTKIAVTNMLNRLYKKGLAERLPNGRLKVN